MSYQSVKTPRARDNASSKWLLISASVLSVVTFIALKNLVWLAKEAPHDQPAAAVTTPVAVVQSEEPAQPDIDPASLSDARAMPAPPVQINPTESADPKNDGLIEISPQSLGSPGEIEALLGQLKIAAVTENKAIINGLLFEADDFIDAGKRLKLVSQKQGKLVFEVNGVRYTHKLK